MLTKFINTRQPRIITYQKIVPNVLYNIIYLVNISRPLSLLKVWYI